MCCYRKVNISLTSRCKIQLTESGAEIINEYHNSIGFNSWLDYETGDIYKDSLFEIMLIFGSSCDRNQETPFEWSFEIQNYEKCKS